jgi:hypothetical protein
VCAALRNVDADCSASIACCVRFHHGPNENAHLNIRCLRPFSLLLHLFPSSTRAPKQTHCDAQPEYRRQSETPVRGSPIGVIQGRIKSFCPSTSSSPATEIPYSRAFASSSPHPPHHDLVKLLFITHQMTQNHHKLAFSPPAPVTVYRRISSPTS